MSNQTRELENGSFEFTSYENFHFESGISISPLVLVYETYGKLNSKKDNAIVVHHALSTSSHLAATEKQPTPGWWEKMVGPGKALDTSKYFIICINNLGSCYGSSGPDSNNPKTSKIYGVDFPTVSITDMVRSQKMLIDEIGITKLHAIVGSSMGAMLSISWLALYPDHTHYMISISSCIKSYPANRANRLIQKEIIKLDPAWNNGDYSASSTLEGFKSARKHSLLTYRNWAEINDRFINKRGNSSIEHHLDYNAQKFINRFDCNSYLSLMNAMDSYDLSNEGNQSLVDLFKPIQAKILIVSVDSDILLTPSQQQALYEPLSEAGIDTTYINHYSSYGHDAFLVETDTFGQYIQSFINPVDKQEHPVSLIKASY